MVAVKLKSIMYVPLGARRYRQCKHGYRGYHGYLLPVRSLLGRVLTAKTSQRPRANLRNRIFDLHHIERRGRRSLSSRRLRGSKG